MNVPPTLNQRGRQEELGQFLTPAPVADFMASLFVNIPPSIRLLDAGAGAGALTFAFVSRCCARQENVRCIEAVLYEVDPLILDTLRMTMGACRRMCESVGIKFSFEIHPSDFIEEMSARLAGDMFAAKPPSFDVAITNPPYRKISSDSPERHFLRSLGVETSNLYTGFIAIIHRLLSPGGQLVAITPRSFCNGPYFRPFREDFLSTMALHRLHVFESRKAAFRADGVLQENVIFHALKGQDQPSEVIVSSSSGLEGDSLSETRYPFVEIVHSGDSERFIHVPSEPSHELAKASLASLNTSLEALGLAVSTGRVVDFRLKDALRKDPELGAVPLLYPCHFNGGTVHWPKTESRKPNAILDTEETRPWLVPSGVYLLTKRFTSKEERRRVVACLFDPEEVETEWVGFENHLNYFHARGIGLERLLAKGLYAYLNSTVVDQYFRRFSGHTQVNATDLRKLTYPDSSTLRAIGSEMKTLNLQQDQIDDLVNKHLHGSR